MSNFISFCVGTLFGAYLSQNYNLPDVKSSLNTLLEHVKTLEENNRTNNNNNSNNTNK